jgi:mRNA-degrading endonuclease RelE of RelBE toxin-antitoxin system
MQIVLSDAVIEALKDAPPPVQRAFQKQLRFLAQNPHHPSLRAKKYSEASDIWQARVTRDWRFYFGIKDDVYVIRALIPHPK